MGSVRAVLLGLLAGCGSVGPYDEFRAEEATGSLSAWKPRGLASRAMCICTHHLPFAGDPALIQINCDSDKEPWEDDVSVFFGAPTDGLDVADALYVDGLVGFDGDEWGTQGGGQVYGVASITLTSQEDTYQSRTYRAMWIHSMVLPEQETCDAVFGLGCRTYAGGTITEGAYWCEDVDLEGGP